MSVSMAEVARHCDVSIATVSRSLDPSSSHPVNVVTRKRVLAAAAELGYRSNAIGRALRTGRTQLVGVLVHDIQDPYFAGYARGISDVARNAGFLTMVCSSDRDVESVLAYVRMLRDNRAAGVFFVASGFEDPGVNELMDKELALIREYGGVAMALSPHSEDLPCEIADDTGGARRVVDYLIGLGHRRIAFIGGPAGFMTSTKREEGYLLALTVVGLPIDRGIMVRGDFGEDSGRAAILQILDASEAPTAVFCASDAMAIGCLQELKRRNISVPEELSIAGFGDIPVAVLLEPALTTVSVPMAEIGAAAMHRMLSILAGAIDADDKSTRVHPVQLNIRGTTGPPRHVSSAVAPRSGAAPRAAISTGKRLSS